MVSVPRTFFQSLLGAILIAVLCGLAQAATPNTIKEVTVAPDLRRVVIKCSEPVGELNTFRLDRPPRLVVDLLDARPDRNLKPEKPEQNGGLKVQITESKTGSHVVLEFGGAPLPELRVRRIGAYVIVFMEGWKPLKQAASQAQPEKKTLPKPIPNKPKVATASFPQRWTGRSDLVIKSARVVDGLIVLTVADRQRPERVYRIDLGVNFDQMGFVSAGIYPLQAQPGGTFGLTTKAPGQRIGPRREAPPQGEVKRGPVRMMSSKESRRTGSQPKQASFGPGRSPQPAPATGPVSLRLRNSPRGGWVANKFPQHSVVESVQAKLFAYRQAPLVRSEACGFTPPAAR